MPDNPCGGVYRSKSGMDSRPTFLLKRSFQQGFFCGYIKILRAFLVRSNVNSDLCKIAGCPLQSRTLLKHCYTINFLKNILLRQLVLGTFSEKNLW